MALLFCHETVDPQPWLSAFRALDPKLEVRLWPELGSPDEIEAVFALRLPLELSAPLRNLTFVQCFGTGADKLLSDPRIPSTVPIARLVNEQQTRGMVEFVLGIVLGWHRHFDAFRTQQKRAQWRRLPHPLASERTVGVLGLGAMGTALARCLADFGFNVRGWSRSEHDIPGILSFAGMDRLFGFAEGLDCVICLLPLGPETREILGAPLFARMAAGGYVINVGRGGHCNVPDLIAALDGGRLSGAWLDVFDAEPLPSDSELWRHDKITISPHAGTMSRAEGAAELVIDNLHRVRRGEPVLHPARAT